MHRPAAEATVARSRRCVAVGSWTAELLPPQRYRVTYTPLQPIIGFAFDGQVGVHAFASDRRTAFRASPNGLACVPIGCEVYSQSDRGGEYLRIALELDLGDPPALARRFSDVIDPVAIDAAQDLRRRLLADDPVDPLECEGLVQTIVERAARVVRGGSTEPRARSWMTPRRLRLVDEVIEERLGSRLTVKDLADALGLSPGFLSRALRAAIGKAPHDYIIDRRLGRARALLRRADLDLSAIARASGFASHAHMTATFRLRLGIAPSRHRSTC